MEAKIAYVNDTCLGASIYSFVRYLQNEKRKDQISKNQRLKRKEECEYWKDVHNK